MTTSIQIYPEASDDAEKIFNQGEYDVPVKNVRRILDIGGNFGLFSIKASQDFPEAEIIAYEPWHENAEVFRRNTKDIPQIKLVEAGVRLIGHEGEEMHRGRNRMCCSFHTQEGEAQIVATVSALELPKADLVKIDTEGCELEILQGLDLSETQAVVCEAHSNDDWAAIISLMKRRGFHVYSDAPSVNGCRLLKFTRDPRKDPKVFIGLPIYGMIPWHFSQCIRDLERNAPCSLIVGSKVGDSLVNRSRNAIAAEFLESDATHLLFIDSDLIFSPDHVKALLAADRDIIAGLYPKKQEGPVQWVVNACFEETTPDAKGIQQIRYAGTGFLLIRREVFVKMIDQLGDELWYTPDDNKTRAREYDFFKVGVYQYPDGTRRFLSEDWYFCQMAMDLGYQVFAHTRVVCKHIGTATYPLKSQEADILKKKEEVAA